MAPESGAAEPLAASVAAIAKPKPLVAGLTDAWSAIESLTAAWRPVAAGRMALA